MIREASEKGHLSKDVRKVWEQMLGTSGGRAFETEETVCAKALNQGHSWCFRRSEAARVDKRERGSERPERRHGARLLWTW